MRNFLLFLLLAAVLAVGGCSYFNDKGQADKAAISQAINYDRIAAVVHQAVDQFAVKIKADLAATAVLHKIADEIIQKLQANVDKGLAYQDNPDVYIATVIAAVEREATATGVISTVNDSGGSLAVKQASMVQRE